MKKTTVLSFLLLLLGLGNVWGDDGIIIPIQHHYATLALPDGLYTITIPEGVTAYNIEGELNDIEKNPEAGIDFRLRLTEIELDADRKITATEVDKGSGVYRIPPMILFAEIPDDYKITGYVYRSSKGRNQTSNSRTCLGVYSFNNMLIPGIEGMRLDEVMANMLIDEKVTELDNYLRDKATSRSGYEDPDQYYYYKLSTKTVDDVTRVGFFWGAEGGASFESKFLKAYLSIPKSFFNASPAKKFRLIDESGLFSSNVATGITLTPRGDAPELMIEEAAVYDLQGRKVANPQPGHIYIRNGKKFIK